MARIRSSPAIASRHTGQRFERGYQYSYPKEFRMTLGPWDRVWPLGEHDIPVTALQSLQDGTLIDGSIRSMWSEGIVAAGGDFVGMFEFSINGVIHFFHFFTDIFGSSVVIYGSTFANIQTAAIGVTIPRTARVVADAWQDTVYFAWEAAASIYKLNTTTDVVSAVAGSPANVEHMLMLENNLTVIHVSGNTYEMKYSVDSLPEDFAGVGSGAIVLEYGIGRPLIYEPFKKDAMIIAERGGVQIQPTGSTPPFVAIPRKDIIGALTRYCGSSDGASIYYVGRHGYIHVYDGNQQSVGQDSTGALTQYDGRLTAGGAGGFRYDTAISMYYSRRIDRLVISDPTNQRTFFLDEKLNYTGDLAVGFSVMSDAAFGEDVGGWFVGFSPINPTAVEPVTGYTHYFDLSPEVTAGNTAFNAGFAFTGEYKLPAARTGLHRIGREVWIDRIELVRLTRYHPNPPELRVDLWHNEGECTTLIFSGIIAEDVQDNGDVLTYFVNSPCIAIQVSINMNNQAPLGMPTNIQLIETDKRWNKDEGIKKIEVYGRELNPDA